MLTMTAIATGTIIEIGIGKLVIGDWERGCKKQTALHPR
jgi:hypothetical protein